MLCLFKYEQIYQAIKEENKIYVYSISVLYNLENINKTTYYKGLYQDFLANELKNRHITNKIEKIHMTPSIKNT